MSERRRRLSAGSIGSGLVALMIGLSAVSTWAQPATAGESPVEPMILSIEESIRLALENSLDIVVERVNPKIFAADVEIERASFDPELQAGVERGAAIRSIGSTVEEFFLGEDARETNLQYSLGLNQRLLTGTSYELSLGVTRLTGVSTVLDPNFSSDLTLTVTQPLLRGFGPAVTQMELRVARNNYLISREAFEIKVAEVIEKVEKAYWDLVFQRKNLKVQQEALRAAQELWNQNRAKAEQGLLAAIEVLVAETGVAGREEDVVIAEKDVKDAEDRLRLEINPPGRMMQEDRAIIPSSDPVLEERHYRLEETVSTAQARRPELKRARLDIENRGLLLAQARSELKPGLDFTASAGLQGLGDSYYDNFDRLGSGDFYNWEAGLVFSMPLGNRAARHAFYKRRNEQDKAAFTLKKLEQELILDLKEAIREVETGLKRMESARKARALAEIQLEAENERFRVGLTTTRNLLEFQEDLAEAQNRELRAITDYNKALTELGRTQGTLLDERGIRLSDSTGR